MSTFDHVLAVLRSGSGAIVGCQKLFRKGVPAGDGEPDGEVRDVVPVERWLAATLAGDEQEHWTAVRANDLSPGLTVSRISLDPAHLVECLVAVQGTAAEAGHRPILDSVPTEGPAHEHDALSYELGGIVAFALGDLVRLGTCAVVSDFDHVRVLVIDFVAARGEEDEEGGMSRGHGTARGHAGKMTSKPSHATRVSYAAENIVDSANTVRRAMATARVLGTGLGHSFRGETSWTRGGATS